MGEALKLAQTAAGTVAPRPPVGAVVVDTAGTIVGRGATQPSPGEHAEEIAIRKAGTAARGGRLFCTLEPHTFESTRPPCTDHIIAAGLAEVIAGASDPNPRQTPVQAVLGAQYIGFTYFGGGGEDAGKDAELATELETLLEGFKKHVTTGAPFVTAKIALTADGKSASRSGDSRWITNEEARQYAHDTLRARADAILTSATTAINDAAELTARLSDGSVKTPVRIVLDRTCKLPKTAPVLLAPGKSIVFVGGGPARAVLRGIKSAARAFWPGGGVKAGGGAVKASGAGGVSGLNAANGPSTTEYHGVRVKGRRLDLAAVLKKIGDMGYCNVLVEAGSALLGGLIDIGAIDRFEIFIAPKVVGGAASKSGIGGAGAPDMASALQLTRVKTNLIGDNVHISGYARSAEPADGESEAV